jgi:hypothetical protein
MKTQREFEKTLLETVDKNLRDIFGEAATTLIYNYLEADLSLKKEEIPIKIDVFKTGLKKFLSTGACVIQKTILERLYESYGLKWKEKENWKFEDYIDDLRRQLDRKQR